MRGKPDMLVVMRRLAQGEAKISKDKFTVAMYKYLKLQADTQGIKRTEEDKANAKKFKAARGE